MKSLSIVFRFVRQAIIFGASSIFTSMPPVYLLEEYQNEVSELRQWLSDVSDKDSNEECVKRALQALYLLNTVIEQNETRN